MSNITAPSPPSAPMYIGKGLTGTNGRSVQIFGQVLPNDGVLGTNVIENPSITGATTLFDASSLVPNREIPVVLYNYKGNFPSGTLNTLWTWVRKRDSKIVYTLSFSSELQSNNIGFFLFAWIGWLSDNLTIEDLPTYPEYPEIQENGDYYVRLTTSGVLNYSSPQVNFNIVGIPPKTLISSGSGGIKWELRLSNYFDSSNYVRAGICLGAFTDGQSFAPSNIIAYNNAPSSANGGTYVSGVVSSIGGNDKIYGFAQAANGQYYRVGEGIDFVGTPIVNVTPSKTSLKADVSWIVTQGAFYDVWAVKAGEPFWSVKASTPNKYATIELDNEWTDYQVRIIPRTGGGGELEPWGYSPIFKTADLTDPVVSIDTYQTTNSSITLYASGQDIKPANGNASGIAGYYFYMHNGTDWVHQGTSQGSGQGSYGYYGLTQGVTYRLGVRSYDNALRVSSMATIDVVAKSMRPSNFYWTYGKSANGRFNLTATEWNNFTDAINKFRQYQNLATIGFTTAPYLDGRFYAFMMNQALVGIRGGYLGGTYYSPISGINTSSLPGDVASGQIVYAWYLNNMVDALNSTP